ncbi:MAG: dihydrofolate reductase family protein [Polyangiaceae bacterium]
MSKVFFSVTMSVDGFIAPVSDPSDIGQKRWFAQWMELQRYALAQRFLREKLKLGEGGESGRDNQLLQATFARTGVSIMGKRMFDAGEHAWPEEAPFETPVFVLTQQRREPWPRKGGTTFYFVNDGIHSALQQAREGAKGRDIRVAGGANTIIQYLNAGLIDEFHLALSPVFLGAGVRLFEQVNREKIGLELVEAVNSPSVTHLMYRVKAR